MADSSANWLGLDLDPGTAEFFGLPQRLYVPIDPESPLYGVDRRRVSIETLAAGLERAMQENPDAMARADLRRFVARWPAIADLDRYVRIDNPTFATRVARDLLREDPGDPVPLAVLAWLAARDGRWTDALRDAERALERAPTHAPLQLQYALILSGTGDSDGAVDRLRDLADHPRYQGMARLWLREITTCDPERLPERLLTGLSAFQHVLDGDGSDSGWSTLAGAFPGNPEVLYGRAVQPGALEPREREQLLRAALAADPDHILATSALGLLLKTQGRASEALDLLDDLLMRLPRASLTRAHRGQTLELLGRTEEALADYRTVFGNPLAQIPEAALLTAGLGLIRLAPREEAGRTLRDAAVARPGDALLPRMLARIEEQTEGPDAAEQLLRKALRDCGPDPALSYALGDLLRRVGRTVEAEGLFKGLVKRHPDSPWGTAVWETFSSPNSRPRRSRTTPRRSPWTRSTPLPDTSTCAAWPPCVPESPRTRCGPWAGPSRWSRTTRATGAILGRRISMRETRSGRWRPPSGRTG